MRYLLLIAPLSLAVQPVTAASFDCSKAHLPIEKLICSDAHLSKIDDDLAAAYEQAIAKTGSKSTITQWQWEWSRYSAVASCKNAQCLETAISSRIALLQNVALRSEATSKWNGKYIRSYRGKIDKDSASLLLVGLSGNRVHILGSAIWLGPNAAIGQVNTGEIEGIGTLNNGSVTFDINGCEGELRLSSAGVTVENESGCGGWNVSFIGDYQKK